ncbi:alcohol oxidase [Irpex lacteus]|nr:alcohol oxidase [Irpex lacteus]
MVNALEEVANQSFDYVVVGGGTAGLVLAARLTEDPNVTVAVLEGGDANLDDPTILRTGVYAGGFMNPKYDWAHMTTKQKLLAERSVHLARGRGLGGSSGMNFNVWQRPPAEELNDWERLGNPGWNWENVHKYIKKAENFVEPPAEVQAALNIPTNYDVGRGGPLPISFPLTATEFEKHLQQALVDVGIPRATDPYGGKPSGAYYSLVTYDPSNYSRSYSAPSYYVPNRSRPNLKVLDAARVDRVVTEKAANGNLIATSVEFTRGDKTYSVKANKEVLLSAGGLSSSVILERSGIGRKDILEKAGVPLKLELPGVGENLQEHIVGVTAYELKDGLPWPTYDMSRDATTMDEQLELYKQGKGSFALGIMNVAFTPVENVTPKVDALYRKAKDYIASLDKNTIAPGLLEQYDIQLERLRSGSPKSGPGCEFIITPGLIVAPGPMPPGKKYLGVAPGLNHQFSRGTIHVISNDPNVLPEIDPHYFEHGVDLDIFVEMVKLARKIAQSPSLKDLVAQEIAPGPAAETDEQIAGFLKQTFSTTWHTAGTCSLLPREKNGVVDTHLKVYGTDNIRVVDMSIIPLHFAAHPQAVVYGIAEMAADIIKGDLKI